ncbi:MAG TPA: phasin family protein [Myxococcaceae bacterium]|nr:phasin family protein [Myxococcaceae bacterium]
MEKTEGSKEKRPISEQLERLWSQALLAASVAEEEASRVAQRVAEVAGWSQDEVKRHVRELSEQLVTQRRDLERSVEEAVKGRVARIKLPKREELMAFEERLNQLAARIDALAERRKSG